MATSASKPHVQPSPSSHNTHTLPIPFLPDDDSPNTLPSGSATNLTSQEPDKSAYPPSVPLQVEHKKGIFNFAKKKKGKSEEDKRSKEKEEEANALPPVSFFNLFRFSTPFEVAAMLFGLFLAVAAGCAQPLMTLIFGRLTTSLTKFSVIKSQISSSGLTPETAAALEAAKHDLKVDAGRNALYLLAIGVGMFLATWVYMTIWNVTGELNAKRVRENYLAAVLRQEIAYFDDLGAGEVATRIQNDCHLVQEGTSEKVALVVQYFGTFCCGFALAFARSPRLAGALFSIFPVIIISGTVMMTFMTKHSSKALEHVAKAGTLAEEVVGSIRTVYAFGKQKLLGGRFDEEVNKSKGEGKKGSAAEGAGVGVIFFSIYAAYALAFFYGGILVVQGHADSGIVINVFLAIIIGSFSMALLTGDIAAVPQACGAAAKLFQTIDRVPLIDSSSSEGLTPAEVHGKISFEGVKFHYPSRPGVTVLKSMTAKFEAGNTIALVGASGSGKSTVVALVERFYDPVTGVVKLDGRNLKTLNVKWLRQQIGLVSQEPTLFGTTIRVNIEHGLIGSRYENAAPEEKFELIKRACIDAHAHDFIMKLPEGYDTMIGERAILLSGGQKQRIAIARAIVSDPRILLLDEATSALDTQSEGIVQSALDRASKGRTTITIAHRLSTVRHADAILVMGFGGEILEQGTHDELLADPEGPYSKLVEAQKLSQETAAHPSSFDDQPLHDDSSIADTPLTAYPDIESPGLELKRATTGRSMESTAMAAVQSKRAEDKLDRSQSSWGLYIRLVKMNWASKRLYIFGTMAAIASGMVYPAIAILFGKAIADFEIQDHALLRHALNRKALWYFVTALGAAAAMTIQNILFSWAGWNLNALLRQKSFQALLRHDIGWFDEEEHSTGALVSNLADQPQKVQDLFGTTVGAIIQSLSTLVGGCIIGLCYGPLLSLIAIACIPVLVADGYIRLKVVVLKDQRMKSLHAGSAHMASEAVGSVRTVASLTREKDVERIYSEALEAPMKLNFRTSLKSQCLFAASQGLSFCIIALVFYVGTLWIISGRYSTASLYTVLNAIIFASIQAGNVFNFVPDASKASSSAGAIFKLVDYVPFIDIRAAGMAASARGTTGHVRLEGVHFRYPTRPGVRVLNDMSIDVPAGTYIALVGPSGCGKSTAIQMIERFYDPLMGRVTLDGVDIKEIDVSSYRDQVALVSQEPTLYAGTIRWNILMGAYKPAEEVTDEEIVKACKDANIYDFIMSLPDGLDTETGSKGTQLSGGQRQRIAIARALIRNPKVLLLDEATSALDSQSERVVQEALDKAAKGRTTIAIAHRLSTIQHADQIYYISEGRVAEHGTHQELLAMRGGYYELVKMQNLSGQQH
ncbi:hypothetical protein IAT38_008177 [Cryptococcus sp. DSM 104549]